MTFPMDVARLKRLDALQDAAEARGDMAAVAEIETERDMRLDASAEAIPNGRGEIVEALDLAAYFAADGDASQPARRCALLAAAGRFDVETLVALRSVIPLCRDDMDASHVGPIASNALRAMTALRVV